MKNKPFKKIKQIFLGFLGAFLCYVYPNYVKAQAAAFYFDNPYPDLRRSTLKPTDIEWWTLTRLFSYIVLPVVIITSTIVGIVVLRKRKRKMLMLKAKIVELLQSNSELSLEEAKKQASEVNIPPDIVEQAWNEVNKQQDSTVSQEQ